MAFLSSLEVLLCIEVIYIYSLANRFMFITILYLDFRHSQQYLPNINILLRVSFIRFELSIYATSLILTHVCFIHND